MHYFEMKILGENINLIKLYEKYSCQKNEDHKNDMPKIEETFSFSKKIKDSAQLLPVIILIASVIGSIYVGIATATEAASLGVVGALVLSFFQKSLTKESFKLSLLGAT